MFSVLGEVVNFVLVRASLGLIFLWHHGISRFLPRVCRFDPSCAVYAAQALRKHGFLRGGVFALRRVLRCNPLCAGGDDPCP